MSAYARIHILHLLCAVAFAGGIIFEALVLSALHNGRLPSPTHRETESVLSKRPHASCRLS
uniref:Uncharacterized protein n=1 Tax=Neisseria leonii TaxID=2995413 RepID=A0A9X4E1L1_9NEIS|nr:hypothetical protein [Neisseria sp. 51.81]MDD9327815.1 hypothetical protein [Neisseria sp. 51.81]